MKYILATVGVCLLGAMLAVAWSRASRRAQVVRDIEALGGTVYFFWDGPIWFQEWVGKSPFESLGRASVGFLDVPLTPEQLKRVEELLARMDGVEVLALAGTTVDDSWLREFQGVPRIAILFVEVTNVTDAGLENVLRWKDLEIVKLQGNSLLTRAAVERLEKKRPSLAFTTDPMK